MGMMVRALRGATTVDRDSPETIVEATQELLEQMLARNEAAPDHLISLVFTTTPDLISEFPAAAARALGISDVPLLCATEIAVPGAMPRCIRVLMHLHTELGRDRLRHVYLNDASQLRTDLSDTKPEVES